VLSTDRPSELYKVAGVLDDMRRSWARHEHPDQSQVVIRVLKELVDSIAATQPVNIARIFKETSGFYSSNDM
jgi:hypothetical protein